MSKNKHLPEVSGADALTFTGGSTIVDTGLRDLQTAAVNIQGTLSGGAGEAVAVTWSRVAQSPGETAKILIEAWQDDHDTAATAAITVSWFAIGN